jgi:hypothetical protein
MTLRAILVWLLFSGAAVASSDSTLPPEVETYVADRELCEHFRQEPAEGGTPEDDERREFVRESIEIHCAGTDRRLAALKRRHAGNPSVLSRLGKYEIASEAACIAASACAPLAAASPSLAALQGAWWRDCEDPAAEFLVEGESYSGDFAGSYGLTLTGEVLVFTEGLVDGHGTDVTHRPLSFEILRVNDTELVMRPMSSNDRVGDWRLLSCR